MGLRQLALSLGILATTLFSSADNLSITRCRTPSITPAYTIETAYPNERNIGGIFRELEKVPDAIQERANHDGQRVEIVDTPEDFNRYTQLSVFATRGIYIPEIKTAVIPQNLEELGGGIAPTALHEYGHLSDNAMGLPSNSEEFMQIYQKSVERDGYRKNPTMARVLKSYVDKVGEGRYVWSDTQVALTGKENRTLQAYREIGEHVTNRGLSSPIEFFAGVFSAYYQSRESREALREIYPEAYRFIHQWEQAHAPQCR